MILNIIKVEVVGMFQNLADSIDLKSNEDVKVNKSEILKMIFTIQNVKELLHLQWLFLLLHVVVIFQQVQY